MPPSKDKQRSQPTPSDVYSNASTPDVYIYIRCIYTQVAKVNKSLTQTFSLHYRCTWLSLRSLTTQTVTLKNAFFRDLPYKRLGVSFSVCPEPPPPSSGLAWLLLSVETHPHVEHPCCYASVWTLHTNVHCKDTNFLVICKEKRKKMFKN